MNSTGIHRIRALRVLALAGLCVLAGRPALAQSKLQTLAAVQGKDRGFVVVVDSVKVALSKPGGSSWDSLDNAPDLQVTVERKPAPELLESIDELKQKGALRVKQLQREHPQEEVDEDDPRLKKIRRQIDELESQFRYSTAVTKDAHQASFDNESVDVDAGDQVTFTVQDVDIVFGDLIGEKQLKITPALLRKGQAYLKFGQVLSLKVELRPKD